MEYRAEERERQRRRRERLREDEEADRGGREAGGDGSGPGRHGPASSGNFSESRDKMRDMVDNALALSRASFDRELERIARDLLGPRRGRGPESGRSEAVTAGVTGRLGRRSSWNDTGNGPSSGRASRTGSATGGARV